MDRYDTLIIGSGPAGISAAITLKVRNKSFLIFGSADLSEKVSKAHKISNYPGLPAISGADLAARLADHIKSMGIEITEKRVTNVYAMGEYFSVQTSSNEMIEAKSIIVASGVSFGQPYPGEVEFLGRGVSYCATCDGHFFKEKPVAVISDSKKEEAEAVYLSELASKVYYIPRYEGEVSLPGNNIEILRDIPVSIEGSLKTEALTLKDSKLSVDGVFILRESVAPGQLVPGLELDGNHIKVSRKMETNIPGCFACGDITGTPYQYIKSAGEGNVAAISAVNYLG